MSSESPRHPAEITDAIIGFVWPDAEALCACSLVCRNWINSSRHNLFSSITLDSKRCDALVDQIILRPSSSMEPYLAQVRELVLVGIRFDAQAGVLVERTLGGGSFHALAGHLPNLRGLSFIGCDFRQAVHSRVHMALSRFSSVRVLELKTYTFPSFHTFRRIISALVSLEHLSMVSPTWDVGPTSAQVAAFDTSEGRPALRSLELSVANHGTTHAKVLIEWLLSTHSQLSLHTLRLLALDCPSNSPFWPSYSKLLESLPSVSELTVCAFENEGAPAPLRDLTALEDLEVIRFDRSLLLPRVNWEFVCGVLRQVRSPLRRLCFTINRWNHIDADADPEDVPSPSINVEGLELLDLVLAHPQFRYLEIVHFTVQDAFPIGVTTAPTFSCAPIVHDLQKTLPKLYARGIVRVALTTTAPLHPAITGNIPGFSAW